MGDPAGIGPEVALRAAAAAELARDFDLSIVGSVGVLETWASRLGVPMAPSVVDPCTRIVAVEPGRPSTMGAGAAVESIVRAAEMCRSGAADAMVTGPVAKAAIADAGYEFTGHTEFLANLLGAPSVLMLFVHGGVRVGLATTHLPLADVPAAITFELLVDKLVLLAQELDERLGVSEPRIAVAGLNPHAGESGRTGSEEETIIVPAIEEVRAAGFRVDGPFPADTVFLGLGSPGGDEPGSGFDAVLAMYHDQGTIPVKLRGRGGGVNVTLGLPIVRTSVDHGTAFDRAGRVAADPESMIAAVRLAGEIAARAAGA
jgi:4-hydroxythreonine-4-phosphate dehydrogenase